MMKMRGEKKMLKKDDDLETRPSVESWAAGSVQNVKKETRVASPMIQSKDDIFWEIIFLNFGVFFLRLRTDLVFLVCEIYS